MFIRSAASLVISLLCGVGVLNANAQSVQPLIAEYVDHASGSFEVTNNTLAASVVQLEAKSFTITPDGTGEFTELDPTIHLELSAKSLRLEPHQTAHVFYKVTAENVPAWLCIYSSFSPLKMTNGLNVRIMLPHTIYVYQKHPLQKDAIEVADLKYDAKLHRITCELTNNSDQAGRASAVEVNGPRSASANGGGFPMLPHGKRILSIDWPSAQEPKNISINFEHFSVKRNITE